MNLPWWLPVGKVPEISPNELKKLLDAKQPPQIVDARTQLEFALGTLPGARHAALTGMPQSLERLESELEAGAPVVLLCLSGHRSRPGTRWLRARGYEAYSLEGGLLAWRAAGFKSGK